MPASQNGFRNGPIETRLLDVVEETVAAHKMFQPGESILVSVSGGPDSVALLYILLSLAPKLFLDIGVAHFNHCLRKDESDRDAEFVASLSKHLGLPFYTDKMDVQAYRREKKLSLETAARQVRYSFLYRIADENHYCKISTGHHQEDNAEAVLMDLFRGCGPRGLAGIPPVRGGRIIRPLLDLSRADIDGFLKEKGLKGMVDATNTDTRYLRNKIRHELMPTLKASYNPGIVKALNRLSHIVRSEEDWIEGLVDQVFRRIVLGKGSDPSIALSVAILKEQHIAMQRRIIRRALDGVKGDLKRIQLAHIEMVLGLAKTGTAHRSLDLPDRIRVSLNEKEIVFSKETAPLRELKGLGQAHRDLRPPEFEYHLAAAGVLSIPELSGRLTFTAHLPQAVPDSFPPGQQTAFFDMDSVSFPLTVRNARPGDRFVPLGMTGTQKVSTFFIDHKVPRPKRGQHPVVLDGEGRLMWVVGQRIDDFFRVVSATRRVLKGEYLLPKLAE